MAAETSTTIITAVIAGFAALVGAAIGAAASLRTNARNIKIENITKERAKWRDKVRKIALAVQKDAVKPDATALEEHHLQFSLILNPFDNEDCGILRLIREFKSDASESRLTEFADRIALLLKHDWERAKWEANDDWSLSTIEPEPKRIPYDDLATQRHAFGKKT
jgi:hypothetical protein